MRDGERIRGDTSLFKGLIGLGASSDSAHSYSKLQSEHRYFALRPLTKIPTGTVAFQPNTGWLHECYACEMYEGGRCGRWLSCILPQRDLLRRLRDLPNRLPRHVKPLWFLKACDVDET